DELQDYLDIVNQSGDHLLALINNILDIAKVEADIIERNESKIELVSFLRAITSMLSIRAQNKGLALLLEQETTLPGLIRTDELKLRQILINLIGNAIKFTEQGQVTIKAVYLAAAQDSDSQGHLQFEVHDTGIGMTEAEQANLFQAFSQTESGRSAEGTGLGLVISQSFVQLLGGDIEVQSSPGQGSVFRFSIAVALVNEGEITPEIRHVEGLASGQPLYKLLVVEDTEFSRILLVNLLKKIGFEVQSAVNGQEAVDLFGSWHPDLIWMDIQMPVMDGKEAIQHIRQLPDGGTLPIIAITASSTLADKDSLLAFGFEDVVYKPFREGQIIECLEAQLGAKFSDKQTVVIETPAQVMEKLDEGQLRAIPDETRKAIRKAAIEGDIEQLQHI
ncbi:MAG: response regulator, partial [Gammaproteobacteria bacterium]|nr:response regulator [Gammaproteobacteria bacterium]